MSQEIPFTCFVQILRRFLSTVKIAIYRTKTRLKAIIKISKHFENFTNGRDKIILV